MNVLKKKELKFIYKAWEAVHKWAQNQSTFRAWKKNWLWNLNFFIMKKLTKTSDDILVKLNQEYNLYKFHTECSKL